MKFLKYLCERDEKFQNQWTMRQRCTVNIFEKNLSETFNEIRPTLADSSVYITRSDGIYAALGKNFLAQGIVPIVRYNHKTEETLCLGTGFIISCSGLLFTAAHVLPDPPANKAEAKKLATPDGESYGILLPFDAQRPDRYLFRAIKWVIKNGFFEETPMPGQSGKFKPKTDTAICQVQGLPGPWPYQSVLTWQPHHAYSEYAIEQELFAIGYGELPEGVFHMPLDSATGALISKREFALHLSKGKVTEHLISNERATESLTPGPNFRTSIEIPAGMSGSPLFSQSGLFANGIASTGWEHEPASTASILAPLFATPIMLTSQGLKKPLSDFIGSKEIGLFKVGTTKTTIDSEGNVREVPPDNY